MTPAKAARAARCATSGDPQKFAALGKPRDFSVITDLAAIQSSRLARRFGVPASLAPTIAGLPFGEGRP